MSLRAAPWSLRFIVNPRSGCVARALPAVRDFAAARGAGVHLTEHRGHAGELARTALAEGCPLIVAVGGDGTMNEVASVLSGTAATLGLIPCGSGNGLGRHLGIHGSARRALEILEHGEPRLIDTGLADGHAFFTTAGLGFEAEIAQRFNELKRRGFLRYLTTSAGAFAQWRPVRYQISHDGGTDEITAFTVAVANASQYGNNAQIAPAARIDDGLLDLCAVPPLHAWNVLPLAIRLFSGSMDRGRGVLHRRAKRFVVERPAAGPLHTDGEIHAAGAKVEFTLRPASLRVMAPLRSA